MVIVTPLSRVVGTPPKWPKWLTNGAYYFNVAGFCLFDGWKQIQNMYPKWWLKSVVFSMVFPCHRKHSPQKQIIWQLNVWGSRCALQLFGRKHTAQPNVVLSMDEIWLTSWYGNYDYLTIPLFTSCSTYLNLRFAWPRWFLKTFFNFAAEERRLARSLGN